MNNISIAGLRFYCRVMRQKMESGLTGFVAVFAAEYFRYRSTVVATVLSGTLLPTMHEIHRHVAYIEPMRQRLDWTLTIVAARWHEAEICSLRVKRKRIYAVFAS